MKSSYTGKKVVSRIICLTLFFCILYTHNSFAQTAAEIINKHIKAIGGQQKIDAISSYKFEIDSRIVVQYKKPGKWRLDFMKDGKIDQTEIYHGEKGWSTFKNGESQATYSGLSFENFLPGYLTYVTAPNFKIESLGADTESDNLLIKVTPLVNNSLYMYYLYYINPSTYLITKMKRESDVASYEVYFEDYITQNGISIPMKITKVNSDKGHLRYSELRTKVQINIPLDDKLFLKPALKKELSTFKGPDDKIGYKDENFITVIQPKYDDAWNFTEGLAKVKLKERFGFIDEKGKVIIPIQYTDADGFYDGLSSVEIDKKRGYIDKTGKIVIPAKYDRWSIFRDGMAVVKLDTKWGVINKKGEAIIPFEYDYIGFFKDGKVSVKKDGIGYFIDKNGTKVD